MRTVRRKGDIHPIHLVWVATDQTAICGATYPQLRIAVEYRHNHPILERDPLFCVLCAQRADNPAPAHVRAARSVRKDSRL